MEITTPHDNEPRMAGYDSTFGWSNVLIKSPAGRPVSINRNKRR